MIELPASADFDIYGPAFSWWNRMSRESGRLPSRSDLDPNDISPQALPYVLLVDIIGQADDMRFRLMGTAHDKFNPRGLTGELFSTVYPTGSPIFPYVKSLYLEMINARRPIWSVNEVCDNDGAVIVRMKRLMLPLSSDGRIVDKCLVIQKIDHPEFPGATVRNSWVNSLSPSETERQLL